MLDSASLEKSFIQLEFQKYKQLINNKKSPAIPPYLVNARDDVGHNLLFYASLHNDMKLAKGLILCGAFIVENPSGLSPMSWVSDNAELRKILSYRYGGKLSVVNDPLNAAFLPSNNLSITLLPVLYQHILRCMVARGFKPHISNEHIIEFSTERVLNSMDRYMRYYIFDQKRSSKSTYSTIESYSDSNIGLPRPLTDQQEQAVKSLSMLFQRCLVYMQAHHNTQYHYDILSSVFLRFGYDPTAVYEISQSADKKEMKGAVISEFFTRVSKEDLQETIMKHDESKDALKRLLDMTPNYRDPEVIKVINAADRLNIKNTEKMVRMRRISEEDSRLQGVARLVMEFAHFELREGKPIATIDDADVEKVMDVISIYKESLYRT